MSEDHSQRPSVPRHHPSRGLADGHLILLRCPEITLNSEPWVMATFPLPIPLGRHFAASHTQRRKPGRQRLGDSDPSKQLVVVLSGCRKHLGPQTPLKTTGGADNSRHYQS